MVFAPTPSQQEAIDTVDRHLAVTAGGAGSGKTRVLVERYLNLIDQGGIPLKNSPLLLSPKRLPRRCGIVLRSTRPD